MDEVVLVTSAKEAEGIGVFDLRTGSASCTNFKNCGCDSAGGCAPFKVEYSCNVYGNVLSDMLCGRPFLLLGAGEQR